VSHKEFNRRCIVEDFVGPLVFAGVVAVLLILMAQAFTQEESKQWIQQHQDLAKRCEFTRSRGWANPQLVERVQRSNAELTVRQRGNTFFEHPSLDALQPIDCEG